MVVRYWLRKKTRFSLAAVLRIVVWLTGKYVAG
jgi:hypothetical protein